MNRLPINLVAQVFFCPPLSLPGEKDTAQANDPIDYPDRPFPHHF